MRRLRCTLCGSDYTGDDNDVGIIKCLDARCLSYFIADQAADFALVGSDKAAGIFDLRAELRQAYIDGRFDDMKTLSTEILVMLPADFIAGLCFAIAEKAQNGNGRMFESVLLSDDERTPEEANTAFALALRYMTLPDVPTVASFIQNHFDTDAQSDKMRALDEVAAGLETVIEEPKATDPEAIYEEPEFAFEEPDIYEPETAFEESEAPEPDEAFEEPYVNETETAFDEPEVPEPETAFVESYLIEPETVFEEPDVQEPEEVFEEPYVIEPETVFEEPEVPEPETVFEEPEVPESETAFEEPEAIEFETVINEPEEIEPKTVFEEPEVNVSEADEPEKAIEINEADELSYWLAMARLSVEDGKFSKALKLIKRELAQNPESGEAYMLKLLCDMRATSEEKLAKRDTDFTITPEYKLAMKYSTPAEKALYQSVADKYNARRERAREREYRAAVSLMKRAAHSKDPKEAAAMFASAASMFDAISDFRDSAQRAALCRDDFSDGAEPDSLIKPVVYDRRRSDDAAIDTYFAKKIVTPNARDSSLYEKSDAQTARQQPQPDDSDDDDEVTFADKLFSVLGALILSALCFALLVIGLLVLEERGIVSFDWLREMFG